MACGIQSPENRPIVNIIWQEIEAGLARLGKTQEWLAEQVGVSSNAVAKWKSGKISRAKAVEVAATLGISLDRLLLGKSNIMVEVLEALPIERSKTMVNQWMYQVEHAEDVLSTEQIGRYVTAMSKLMADMEKRKKKTGS